MAWSRVRDAARHVVEAEAADSFGALASGDCYYLVSGIGSGSMGGFYTISSTITSAVTEPQTLALMLAGLGAIGFVARRRRQG